jgi:predicted DNA-binding transcriptional regulator AlpA
MNLQELIKSEGITLNVKSEDLTAFANQLASQLLEAQARNTPPPPTGETYLTTDEVCRKLSISRVTLWEWDKKKITKPVRFGNLKRYKLSELEKIGA